MAAINSTLISCSILITLLGIVTVTSTSRVKMVLFLITTYLIGAAIIASFAKANFVALMILIVYAGAVAVLFLFVVMILSIIPIKSKIDLSNDVSFTCLILLGLLFLISSVIS